MTPDQEAHLLNVVTKTGTKMDALISDDHQDGLVPEAQRSIQKHSDQINFWRGSIAVIAFMLLVFGAILATHLMGGK
jgi:hypothetical protein